MKRIVFTFSVLLGLALAILALQAASRTGRPPDKKKAHPMLTYEVLFDRTEFVYKERIDVTLRLVNNGTTALVLPDPMKSVAQPTFLLKGGKHPEGIPFHPASRLGANRDSTQPDAMIRIEPGKTWEGKRSLSLLTNLETAGDYTLDSALEAAGLKAVSPQKHFRIRKPKPQHIQIGISTDPPAGAMGDCVFLEGEGPTRSLYTMAFRETRPDLLEAETMNAIFWATAGPNAVDVACPQLNYSYYGKPEHWIVWREGRAILARISSEREPYRLQLSEEPDAMVMPPLQTPAQTVEMLLLSKERSALSLVRFADSIDPAKAGKQIWKIGLPAKPDAIVDALAPSSLQTGTRYLAFATQQDETLVVYYAAFQENAPPPLFRPVKFVGVHLMPQTSLSLLVDNKGVASLLVAAQAHTERKECLLAEMKFGADGQTVEKPRTRSVGRLAQAPVGGAVFQMQRADRTLAEQLVLVAQENQVYALNHAGQLELIHLRQKVPQPVLLAPGKANPYLLVVDPESGIHFVPI